MPSTRGIRKAGQDIFTVNFADYLPGALKQDTKIRAIAEAVTKEALEVSGEIENVLIYSRIDELPELLIDILAYDMHVDWYDYSFPLKIKRNILKGSVKVHKKMGTKYAVENVLQDVYRTAAVEEWFEYGGKPYTFRINVDVAEWGLTEETSREIEGKMKFYKNLRSHCDGIFYYLGAGSTVVKVSAYAVMGSVLKVKAYTKSKIISSGMVAVAGILKSGSLITVRKVE